MKTIHDKLKLVAAFILDIIRGRKDIKTAERQIEDTLNESKGRTPINYNYINL